jgi:hypothetical protein
MCWLGWNFALGHIREFARVVRALTFLAPALVSLEMINALLAIHPLNMDSPTWIPCWTFNLIQTLNFLCTLLSYHFYTCLICRLVVFLAWSLNIFEIILTLKI